MTKKKITTPSESEFIIEDSIAKMKDVFSKYNPSEISVSYSGGSDSDVMRHLIASNGYSLKHVFFNTGIEYRATLKYIKDLQNNGVDIDVIRPEIPIPLAIKKYGSPFISKNVSEMIYILQQHDFNFQNSGTQGFEGLWAMYPNTKIALKWWTNTHGMKRRDISNNRYLKEFLIKYGIPFKVSAKCCYYSKKKLIKNYSKKNGIMLNVIGIRKSEGGVRSYIKNCYNITGKGKQDTYFPLFWWNDDVKEYYRNKHDIVYSECYSVYGVERTGCAGCPYGRTPENELAILKEYEPGLYKGVTNIFKDSYEWTKKYREFALDTKSKGIKPIIT